MGNKVALALALLATSIGVSACGGTQGAGLAGATSTGARASVVAHGHSDPSKSCESQGIDSTQLGTGACTEGGVQYVVANYGGIVRLRTLNAAVVNVSASAIDAGHGRRVTAKRDGFLRITLEVQNTGRTPQRFGLGQTMLGIGSDNYLERGDVEKQVHREALATTDGGMIGPGETLRGDVVFDITNEDYAQLARVGRFFIWNFGAQASRQITRRTGQIGQIRFYAVEPR